MSQRSRFFDSSEGDRVYTSDAWAQVVAGLVGDGVMATVGNTLAVTEQSPAAMGVRVNTGVAYILGYYFEVYSAQEALTIDAADATNPRIDRIVVRRSLSSRTVELAVLTGTPGASPTAPALTQVVAGTYEIALAQVRVEALATSILNAKITDERSYSASYPLTAALSGSTGHAHDGTTGQGPNIPYANVSGKPSTFAPSSHTHADGSTGGTIAYSVITGKPSTFAPSDHAHTTSGDGGTVAYASLTGKPSTFAPSSHGSSHASGSSDPVTVTWAQITSKPSTFAAADHAISPGFGLHTGTLPWSYLSSVPSTFTPASHAAKHKTGGSDPVLPGDAGGFTRYATTGTAGKQVYVGTTTPSSPTPAEGDIWIKG
ncbi:MAG: hypothetical protein WEG56_13125 [Chloroflexota bacterium]